MNPPQEFSLPGGHLLIEGLADIAAGRESAASLLVRVGAPRFRAHGYSVPVESPTKSTTYEEQLYLLLASEHGRSRGYELYNSLIRQLVSLQNALDALRV